MNRLPCRRVSLLGIVVAALAAPLAVVPQAASASQSAAYRPADDGNPDSSIVYVKRNGSGSCAALTKTVEGTLNSADGRFVNATINFDMFTAAKKPIDGNGCPNVSGYGIQVHVNFPVDGNGVAPADAGGISPSPVMTWSVQLPANAATTDIEVYPQKSSSKPRYGGTDTSRYALVRVSGVTINAVTGPVHVVLPANQCGTKFATGKLTGRFLVNGKPAKGVRVSAFSQVAPGKNPLVSGPAGFGIWNGDGTSYSIPNIASAPKKGQPYVLLARLANGRTKSFEMQPFRKPQLAGVKPCATTRFDLKF